MRDELDPKPEGTPEETVVEPTPAGEAALAGGDNGTEPAAEEPREAAASMDYEEMWAEMCEEKEALIQASVGFLAFAREFDSGHLLNHEWYAAKAVFDAAIKAAKGEGRVADEEADAAEAAAGGPAEEDSQE